MSEQRGSTKLQSKAEMELAKMDIAIWLGVSKSTLDAREIKGD